MLSTYGAVLMHKLQDLANIVKDNSFYVIYRKLFNIIFFPLTSRHCVLLMDWMQAHVLSTHTTRLMLLLLLEGLSSPALEKT